MTLVKKLLLGGIPTVAGGTGVGVFIYEKTKNESLDVEEVQPEESQKAVPGEVQTSDKGLQAEEKPGEAGANDVRESPPAVPNNVQPKGNQGTGNQRKPPAPKNLDLIKNAGLDCGDAEVDKDCTILSTGLNVDKDGKGNKKENLVLERSDNGKIRFKVSGERSDYPEGFRFTIIEKNINLKNGSESLTLEKYENYYLAKSGGKVYLTRRLTADQGKIKILGLPKEYTFPTSSTKDGSLFEIRKELIWYIKFDGRGEKPATSEDKLNLKTYKIDNSKIFKGGYRFSFQPVEDLTMPLGDTLTKNIWWDFRLKDADADDLFLERVWKNENDLLDAVGLTCTEENCEISNGKLKIKIGDSKKEGLSKSEGGSGKIKIHKKSPGHYEGLRFEIKEGDINLSSSQKLEEMEVYEILRDDDDSYYLTRKHGAKEMVLSNLGLGKCTLPTTGSSKTCTIENKDLGNLKVYDGEEKTVSGSGSLTVTISTENDDTTYPYGHKFSLKPTGEVKVGGTDLSESSSHEYKIKKDESRFYLEKLGGE